MILTIVEFRAFDKDCVQSFLDKQLEDIEKELYARCFTYEIKNIKQLDLSTVKLTELKYEKLYTI